METTPFQTFCSGISSGTGIICGTIWGSFAIRGSFAGLYTSISEFKIDRQKKKQGRLLKVVQFSMLIHIPGFSCFWKHHRTIFLIIKLSKCLTVLFVQPGGALALGSSGSGFEPWSGSSSRVTHFTLTCTVLLSSPTAELFESWLTLTRVVVICLEKNCFTFNVLSSLRSLKLCQKWRTNNINMEKTSTKS